MSNTIRAISDHIRRRNLNRSYSTRKLQAILNEEIADELVAEAISRYKREHSNV